MDEITEARRRAIADSIHTISVEELKALGEGLFPYVDHPWREKFFNFIAEHSTDTFHHGTTDDRIHVIYCHGADTGMWFMAGSGMGPLPDKARKILKAIVEGKR